MAYVVALVSAWLALVALTALRPRRRGVLAAISYPVGWVAGELPAQAITVELVLLGLLAWWGWPDDTLSSVVLTLATVIVTLLALLPTEGNRALEFLGKPTLSWQIGIATASILGIIGVLAGYFPARRAAAVNPAETLRYE